MSPTRRDSLTNTVTRFVNGLTRPTKARNRRRLDARGESLPAFTIRPGTRDDLSQLVPLHVTTWNDTYPRVWRKPPAALRARQWRDHFTRPADAWFCLVVEGPPGLVGFATGESFAADDLAGYDGRLSKIYFLRDYQRLGLGRRLMGAVAREFLRRDITAMVLFGEADNPSCAFHEALGGERLYDDQGAFHGGYGWRDLEALAAACPPEPPARVGRRPRT